MKIIQLESAEANTEALVQWMREAPKTERRIMVSCTETEVARLQEHYGAELGMDSFVSLSTFMHPFYRRRRQRECIFGINWAEVALMLALDANVGALACLPDHSPRIEQL